MTRWALACAVLLASVAGASAQEELGAEPTGPRRVEVRTGRTPFDDGAAVPAARVAWVAPDRSPADAEAGSVETDSEGRATLPEPAPGERLIVWSADHAPEVFVAPDPGEPLVVDLDPLHEVVGTVRLGGEPVPEVTVRAVVRLPLWGAPDPHLEAHRFVLSTTTDEQGRFGFGGLASHAVELLVERPGAVPVQLYPVDPVEVPAGDRRVQLDLVATGSVSGTLRRHPGGEPLAAAVVLVEDRVTVTGSDGTFRVGDLPPGPVSVRADGPTVVATERLAVAVEAGAEREGTDLTALASSGLELALAVEDGAAPPLVEITLTWPPTAGTALPAGVTVDTAERAERTVVAVRESDDRYRVPDLLPTEGLGLVVRAQGHAPARVDGLGLPVGVTLPLELRLVPEAVVSGVAVDETGAPVAGVMVEALDDPTASEVVSEVLSRGDGTFRLGSLSAGSVYVRVQAAADGAGRTTVFGPFEARVGEALDAGRLRLEAGLELLGRVVTDTAPRAGVEVVVVRGDAELGRGTVDAQGRFRVTGLPPGPALVRVRADGHGAAEQEVLLPEPGEVELRLRERRRVRGTLRDQDGAPVRTATVQAHALVRRDRLDDRPLDRGPEPVTTEVRNAGGRFELELATGAWTLTAWDSEGRSASTTVVVGEDPSDVDLLLEHGETLRGHVFDAETALPVAGARVRFVPAHDRDRGGPTATTDDSGWFELPGVAPGVLRASVEAVGYAPYLGEPVVVRRAAGLHLGRIELGTGTLLRGTVLTDAGAPAASARVELVRPGGERDVVTTDRFGRFEQRGLPAGDLLLRAGDPARELRVSIPPAVREWEIFVDLGAGTRLEGRVRERGLDVPLARVTAWSLGSAVGRAEARADAYGRYALPPLPPGPVAVEVWAPGRRTPWRTRIRLDTSGLQTLDLELPEGRVRGDVVADRDGRPLAGVFVRLLARDALTRSSAVVAETVTDEQGGFELTGVAAGRYDVRASRAGYGVDDTLRIRVTEETEPEPLRLRLPDEGVFATRIVDRRLRPVPGAWFAARRPDRRGVGTAFRAVADADGRVQLDGLAPGLWSLAAGAPGLGSVDLGVRELREETFDLGDTVLETGGSIEVEVVGQFLQPLAGRYVQIEDVHGRDPRVYRRPEDPLLGGDERFRTDGDGLLVLSGLPEGLYRLWVATEDEPFDPISVFVREQELVPVLLVASD